ncbi:unnamed protein product [Phytophthora fragariaefolia]|uniref:Unnamed protein product n=1 Tax=Phytophthora fragariaefolia TaxID=1490495 RepID=A0A9W6YLX1_9STRA|nr:unnamed protein product [Phytophthora fragariaefolia]
MSRSLPLEQISARARDGVAASGRARDGGGVVERRHDGVERRQQTRRQALCSLGTARVTHRRRHEVGDAIHQHERVVRDAIHEGGVAVVEHGGVIRGHDGVGKDVELGLAVDLHGGSFECELESKRGCVGETRCKSTLGVVFIITSEASGLGGGGISDGCDGEQREEGQDDGAMR